MKLALIIGTTLPFIVFPAAVPSIETTPVTVMPAGRNSAVPTKDDSITDVFKVPGANFECAESSSSSATKSFDIIRDDGKIQNCKCKGLEAICASNGRVKAVAVASAPTVEGAPPVPMGPATACPHGKIVAGNAEIISSDATTITGTPQPPSPPAGQIGTIPEPLPAILPVQMCEVDGRCSVIMPGAVNSDTSLSNDIIVKVVIPREPKMVPMPPPANGEIGTLPPNEVGVVSPAPAETKVSQ